ncbi:MAG TPA: hypothetical protein VF669_20025 [Tepidisphaeraceae bacterium]|jgi:CPA1 family monovalent cation:H+ antiporter
MPDHLWGDVYRHRAIHAAREALVNLRSRGEIGEEAFQKVEEELDRIDMSFGGADD